jgi:hypothetical protein
MVITYFGEFPSYISYFLQTCSFNNEIDFLIFTNNIPFGRLFEADNVKFLKKHKWL